MSDGMDVLAIDMYSTLILDIYHNSRGRLQAPGFRVLRPRTNQHESLDIMTRQGVGEGEGGGGGGGGQESHTTISNEEMSEEEITERCVRTCKGKTFKNRMTDIESSTSQRGTEKQPTQLFLT